MSKKVCMAFALFAFMISLTIASFAKEAVSQVKWNGESDKAVSVNIDAKTSARKNASGAKIPSNAHSADFPGLYFIWDSKQKDNGYLKVDASVFDKYESFVLTSKESNTYWDFEIKLQSDQRKTADNGYVFYIPKVYNNKNINMVFIEQFTEKTQVEDVVVTVNFYEGKECIEGEEVYTFSFDWPKGNTFNYQNLWDRIHEELLDTWTPEEVVEYTSQYLDECKDFTENSSGFSLAVDGPLTITLLRKQDEVTRSGLLTLTKTVNGKPFQEWAANNDSINAEKIGDLLEGITFYAYAVEGPGAFFTDNGYVAEGKLDADGEIFFRNNLPAGWYAIVEELNGLAAEVFTDVGVKYFYLGGESGTIGFDPAFDYDAFYTIVNGYSRGYTLGYPGLNNTGDIFPIGVKNADTDVEYASFCAHAGSKNFAGESGLGCRGYLIAAPSDMSWVEEGKANYADFMKAYNYIEDKYGKLNELRPVTQIVTWALLGSIDVKSEEFEHINWNTVTNGTAAVKGVPGAKTIVEDVLASYKGYKETGNIVAVVYMLCENEEHKPGTCQPQLVPIYATKDAPYFNNVTKSNEQQLFSAGLFADGSVESQYWIQEYWYKTTWKPVYGPSYQSVTATNDANYPWIVPNSNHFTYAVLNTNDLVDGVSLDLVVGNKIDQVGTAFVQINDDGNLELRFYGIDGIEFDGQGTFGAVASSAQFNPSNGNVHSSGSFKHNNVGVIECPDAETIYLYIHFDNCKFIQEYESNKKRVDGNLYKDDSASTEVSFKVYDADGVVVNEGYGKCDITKAGTYTVVFSDDNDPCNGSIVVTRHGEEGEPVDGCRVDVTVSEADIANKESINVNYFASYSYTDDNHIFDNDYDEYEYE